VLFSLTRHKGNKKTLAYVRGNDLLTMNIKDEGDLSRIREDSVDGLTAQHGVQILALYWRPRQTVLNDVTSVVFVLLINQNSVHQPTNGGLRFAW